MDIPSPHCGSTFDIADQQRSAAEHDFYMSCCSVAFDNLPESMHGRWANAKALRYWALKRTGWKTEKLYVAESKGEANRHANWELDERTTAEVKYDKEIKKWVVISTRPRSQSYSEMSKREFRESSRAVLDELSKLIGTDVTTLRREGLSYSSISA